MTLPEIAKLGHVALVTPDLEKYLWFFRDFIGL
jgi:catechol 2,3-dioxygenase